MTEHATFCHRVQFDTAEQMTVGDGLGAAEGIAVSDVVGAAKGIAVVDGLG